MNKLINDYVNSVEIAADSVDVWNRIKSGVTQKNRKPQKAVISNVKKSKGKLAVILGSAGIAAAAVVMVVLAIVLPMLGGRDNPILFSYSKLNSALEKVVTADSLEYTTTIDVKMDNIQTDIQINGKKKDDLYSVDITIKEFGAEINTALFGKDGRFYENNKTFKVKSVSDMTAQNIDALAIILPSFDENDFDDIKVAKSGEDTVVTCLLKSEALGKFSDELNMLFGEILGTIGSVEFKFVLDKNLELKECEVIIKTEQIVDEEIFVNQYTANIIYNKINGSVTVTVPTDLNSYTIVSNDKQRAVTLVDNAWSEFAERTDYDLKLSRENYYQAWNGNESINWDLSSSGTGTDKVSLIQYYKTDPKKTNSQSVADRRDEYYSNGYRYVNDIQNGQKYIEKSNYWNTYVFLGTHYDFGGSLTDPATEIQDAFIIEYGGITYVEINFPDGYKWNFFRSYDNLEKRLLVSIDSSGQIINLCYIDVTLWGSEDRLQAEGIMYEFNPRTKPLKLPDDINQYEDTLADSQVKAIKLHELALQNFKTGDIFAWFIYYDNKAGYNFSQSVTINFDTGTASFGGEFLGVVNMPLEQFFNLATVGQLSLFDAINELNVTDSYFIEEERAARARLYFKPNLSGDNDRWGLSIAINYDTNYGIPQYELTITSSGVNYEFIFTLLFSIET